MLGKWGEVQSVIEKYHPDTEVANRAINLFNDNAVFYFRQELKRRQKQTSLDRFLVRQRPSEPEASSSGAERQKRERTPGEQLPDILKEGAPLPNNNIPPPLLSTLSHQ